MAANAILRPTAGFMLAHPARIIALGFGTGLSPFAPGTVGTLLGNAGVNIDDMDVGRAAQPGTAVMLIAPSAAVPAEVIDELRGAPGITSVVQLAG